MLKRIYYKTKRLQYALMALMFVLTLGSCGEDVGLFDGNYIIDGNEMVGCQYPSLGVSLRIDKMGEDSILGDMTFYDGYNYSMDNQEYRIANPQFEDRFNCTAKLFERGNADAVSEVKIEYDSLENYYRFTFGEMPIEGVSNNTFSVHARIDRVTLAPVYDGVYPSRYYGGWVAEYIWVFGLFAIVMCIPALYHGLIFSHLLMTAAAFFTFYNDYMAFLPCLLGYYLCYPMIYIRWIKPDTVTTIYSISNVICFFYSLYCIYLYDSFGKAFLYMFFWGITSAIFLVVFSGNNDRRCSKCGRFTKKVVLGNAYFSSPKALNRIGSLDFDNPGDQLEDIYQVFSSNENRDKNFDVNAAVQEKISECLTKDDSEKRLRSFFEHWGNDKSAFCFWCGKEC